MSYQLDFSGLMPYLPQFVAGLETTIGLTAISTVSGLLLGTLCAGAKPAAFHGSGCSAPATLK